MHQREPPKGQPCVTWGGIFPETAPKQVQSPDGYHGLDECPFLNSGFFPTARAEKAMALRLRLSLWTPAWHGHSSSSNRNKMMSIWLFDIVPDDGFINWCVTYCYHHLSPQCGNPQLFQSTFGIRIFVHPQVHPRVRQFGKIICKIPWDYGPRGITPRDAQKHPKPQTYRMLLNPWPSMTIHDHPMMRMEKDSPRSATKQKRRTVQHLRKISCRCTSPRPRACRAWIQIANPKIHGETSDIDCDYSHVHSSQLLFLSSIFPIGFFQI